MSIVLELQREAANGTVDVSQVLRKAKIVSVKLGLHVMRTWVDLELDGYPTREVPEYRILKGQIKARNPQLGMVPFVIADKELDDALTLTPCQMGIAAVQDLLTADKEAMLSCDFTGQQQQVLMKMQRTQFPFFCTLVVPRAAIIQIVDSVRNMILDWSLRLESDGIVGEGMSFSIKEKEVAAKNAESLQPPLSITLIGTMKDSIVQQGSPGAIQSHTRWKMPWRSR